MNLYEVALVAVVTGTFRVVAFDLNDAGRKAQLMYANGVEHDIDQIEIVRIREIKPEDN